MEAEATGVGAREAHDGEEWGGDAAGHTTAMKAEATGEGGGGRARRGRGADPAGAQRRRDQRKAEAATGK